MTIPDWLNPIHWVKSLVTNTMVSSTVRHLLAAITTVLVAKHGLSADDATTFIEAFLKILPALIAYFSSLFSKSSAAPDAPNVVQLRRG